VSRSLRAWAPSGHLPVVDDPFRLSHAQLRGPPRDSRGPPAGPPGDDTLSAATIAAELARAYPRRDLHVVVDNYSTHKHPAVEAWLARRITLHFTPTSGSWLNLVEVFFLIITRQAIRRGTFASVPDLIAAIRRFVDGWNERCHPFVWTKSPEDVLGHVRPRKRTSDARH
jgi:hypothetical protein